MTCRRVSGGSLNGQPVSATNDTVTVSAGAPLTGSVVVQTNNTMGPGAVAPLAATVNWGSRTSQYWTANPWIATGVNTYTVNVSRTAPTQPGTYYLIMGFSGMYSGDQVMSSTHPALSAIWNDGNDVGFDWSSQQFSQALANGGTTIINMWMPSSTFQAQAQPSTAVRIQVTP